MRRICILFLLACIVALTPLAASAMAQQQLSEAEQAYQRISGTSMEAVGERFTQFERIIRSQAILDEQVGQVEYLQQLSAQLDALYKGKSVPTGADVCWTFYVLALNDYGPTVTLGTHGPAVWVTERSCARTSTGMLNAKLTRTIPVTNTAWQMAACSARMKGQLPSSTDQPALVPLYVRLNDATLGASLQKLFPSPMPLAISTLDAGRRRQFFMLPGNGHTYIGTTLSVCQPTDNGADKAEDGAIVGPAQPTKGGSDYIITPIIVAPPPGAGGPLPPFPPIPTWPAAIMKTAQVASKAPIISHWRPYSLMRNNLAPVADAGSDQNASTNQAVTLDGSKSYDPDNKPGALTYEWQQTDGPAVTLVDAKAVRASIHTPTVTVTTILTFTLTVNDGEFSDRDTVQILVKPAGE